MGSQESIKSVRWKMRYNLLGSKRARVLEPIRLFQEAPVCGEKAFLLARPWILDASDI